MKQSIASKLLSSARKILHRYGTYWQIRDIMLEGVPNAIHRIPRQRRILSTPPLLTKQSGTIEVRCLTYRADWLNAMWALKTFYFWAGIDFPLHIHDGGLLPYQLEKFKRHFPTASIHDAKSSTEAVEAELLKRGHTSSAAYRMKNRNMWKFYDFYLNNPSDRVITMDSDIVFFKRPDEMLDAAETKDGPNIFNKDCGYNYLLPQEMMNEIAGTEVRPMLNGGLGVVTPKAIDFDFVNQVVGRPDFFNSFGIVEQTMQALCAARYKMDLLSDKYIVSKERGLNEDTVAKHYPSPPRPLLYQEGMATLLADVQWKAYSNRH